MVKFGDKDYALVPDRLKQFREENPRAAVDTEPTYNSDGSVTFKATIVKDQSDEYSAKGTGHARYSENEIKKPKAFEKLETISVGRALANIGYLNDGQVATTEELEEFYEFRTTNKAEQALEGIKSAKTIDELKKLFIALPPEVKAKEEVIEAKDAKKMTFEKVAA